MLLVSCNGAGRVQVQTRGPATAKLLSFSASEATVLWRYKFFIIIIIIKLGPGPRYDTYVRASADRRCRPTSAANRQSLERYSTVRDRVEPSL